VVWSKYTWKLFSMYMKMYYGTRKREPRHKTRKIPLRYLPRALSKKDRKSQVRELLRSRSAYKKGIYHTRKHVKSFKSKPSGHVAKAERMYKINSIGATQELANKTRCSRAALRKIINKGAGAYFSSGSRPNQTAQSWGVARLASAITGGKSARVDYTILEEGCDSSSKALRLAKQVPPLRRTPKSFI
jgi:hypothetical protein